MSEPTPAATPETEPDTSPANHQEPTMDDSTAVIENEPTGGYQPPTTPPLVATATADSAAPGRRPGPSVPTVLWGLVLALVATLAIVHQVSDVDINLAVLVPVVLLAVGATLVAWGIAGLGRKRR